MFSRKLPRILIPSLILTRVALGVLAWDPVYRALTWDDFTRVDLGMRWAEAPFVSADLVWLPSQTWILGGLFKLTGSLFGGNPMVLAAALNTLCVVLMALVAGWTAWKIAGSTVGSIGVLILLLYSPWGFYISLSGLNEGIYYLAVAMAVAGLVSYQIDGRWHGLLGGVAGVTLGAGTRYEGWWLAVAWGCAVMFVGWRKRVRGEDSASLGVASIAAGIPFLVPVLWLVRNYLEAGDPLAFTRLTAECFESAYGGLPTVLGRFLYYPVSFLKTDLLLLALILFAIWIGRKDPATRVITGVVVGYGLLFYVSGLVSGAVGAFNERFMFGFLVAAAPLTANLVGWLKSRLPWVARAVSLVIVASWAVVTPLRWSNPPIEWSHAPDFLLVMEKLGERAESDATLRVALDPVLNPVFGTPLRVFAGDRIEVTNDMGAESDLFVSKDPWSGSDDGSVALGRFLISRPHAKKIEADPMDCPCSGWVFRDELGNTVNLVENPFPWTEFSSLDPLPGQEATVSTFIEPGIGRVSVELRSLYGHGFNPGRLEVQVRLDGEILSAWDVAEPSRWRKVDFAVLDSGGKLEVAVVALEGIESGWAWGEASTVLIRRVEDLPG